MTNIESLRDAIESLRDAPPVSFGETELENVRRRARRRRRERRGWLTGLAAATSAAVIVAVSVTGHQSGSGRVATAGIPSSSALAPADGAAASFTAPASVRTGTSTGVTLTIRNNSDHDVDLGDAAGCWPTFAIVLAAPGDAPVAPNWPLACLSFGPIKPGGTYEATLTIEAKSLEGQPLSPGTYEAHLVASYVPTDLTIDAPAAIEVTP